MSYHHQQQPMNFWDFVNSFDPNRAAAAPGHGVDHNSAPPHYGPAGFFPFGGPAGRHHPPPPGAWPWDADSADFHGHDPWAHRGGPRGRRGGRHGQRDQNGNEDAAPGEAGQQAPDNERDDASETMKAESTAAPDPAEVTPEETDECRPRGCRGRRGGPGRFGRGGPFRYGGHPHHHGHGPHHGPHQPPPPPPYQGFDLSGLMRAIGSHPMLQHLRDFIPPQNTNDSGNTRDDADADADAFRPPVDTFNTPTAYVLHVALPGARKEDVGVSWDADSRQVRIAGVVHRPGDEAFLATLQGPGERRVGLFERTVGLPGDEEVEAMGIAAKMEDGVLVVTVPKVDRGEKEWTEIHKVDVE